MISFFIPGEPQPRQSFRFAVRNNIAYKYQPSNDKAAQWLSIVRLYANQHKPLSPIEGPIKLFVTIYRSRPKSAKKSDLYPTKRPDYANYMKAVEDIFNGIIWVDDSQVVTAIIKKRYENETFSCGMNITVEREDYS
jgi:Holliday junction resolvase RusA-like endonuclease